MAPPKISDQTFPNANKGLDPPVRQLGDATLGLKITNLDRTDPPQYSPGIYPRTDGFNANVFSLTATAAMPRIDIGCEVKGFDPATTPIFWRLQARYVVGRYEKTSDDDHFPVYRSLLRSHEDTWTGVAHGASFTLFRPDPNVTYDNPSGRVAGGQFILTVAVQPPGSAAWLQDYVHLRITGVNPGETEVRDYVQAALATRDPNIVHIVNAVFAWENSFKQFDLAARSSDIFRGFYEPKAPVEFPWPHDPANFPSVAFDFGIGISQWTHWSQDTMAICWDWRENMNAGINELLGDLSRSFAAGAPWRQWAQHAWSSYNGDTTGSYAGRLQANPDGQLVSVGNVPPGFNAAQQTALLPSQAAPPAPRLWPVPANAPVMAEAPPSIAPKTGSPADAG